VGGVGGGVRGGVVELLVFHFDPLKRRRNVCLLFMGPLGADNDTINPATTHIIHAIRRLHALCGPKVTSKWTQSDPHMPKVIRKQPQINISCTQWFYKIIKICGDNVCFWKTDLYIPKVTPQS